MAKKKKNQGQLSLKMGLNDERLPKMIGVLCLFIALYLFIAFTSYLFTWQDDQDRVLRFSWRLLLRSDLEMSNWLGRLGAIISNMFFYWGFGVPSYIFIFLITRLGLGLIRRTPMSKQLPTLRYSLLAIIALSIFLAFVFSNASFSWGGAFGEGISFWLQSFVGPIGVIIIFLFLILGAIVWNFNPNFNELTFSKAVSETQLYITDTLNGRKSRKSKPIETLRPQSKPKALPLQKKEEKEEAPQPDGQQLQFELEEKKKQEKPNPLKAGASELEISAAEQSANEGNVSLSVTEENKDHLAPYDPTLDLSFYQGPTIDLLVDYSASNEVPDRAELEKNKDQIIETLLNYKIEIIKIRATIGPTVTLFEIVPAPGVRISKIKNLEDDIALSLAALGIRIIAPIPGKGTIGIEVPNKKKQMVSMREVLESEKFQEAKMDLPIALGKTIG